jgi:hypothetical protein
MKNPAKIAGRIGIWLYSFKFLHLVNCLSENGVRQLNGVNFPND